MLQEQGPAWQLKKWTAKCDPQQEPGGSSTVAQEPFPTLGGCISFLSSEALQLFPLSCSQLSSFHPSHIDFLAF